MNLKLYGLARTLLIIRALLSDPPDPQTAAYERRQAQRLSAYLPRRLSELAVTPRDLANTLDIEPEFVETLLDGTFPLSALSRERWAELAAALHCTAAYLRQVAAGTAPSPDGVSS